MPQVPRKEAATLPASEARIKANRKYNEKAYDRIELKVPKGKKADLQAHAESKGESLNGLVNRAIDETVARDKAVQAFTLQPGEGGDA
jgi:predicted HicB family RNase H-like nuclease